MKIETFNPYDHRLLGQGVWGGVYDLGDGTVLKLAKEIGGLGSGREKVLHEVRVARALRPAAQNLSFKLPEIIDFGDIARDSALFSQGYVVWLQSRKIGGKIFKNSEIENLPSDDQEKITAALARMLSEMHDLLERSGIGSSLSVDPIFSLLDKEGLPISKADRDRLAIAQPFITAAANDVLVPIHGDPNITNILFNDQLQVSGVLDFAETCLGSYEDDLCSLTSDLPFLKDRIIEQYEFFSGRAVDARKFQRAEIKRDMISLLICRYRVHRDDEAKEAESRLDQNLHCLIG